MAILAKLNPPPFLAVRSTIAAIDCGILVLRCVNGGRCDDSLALVTMRNHLAGWPISPDESLSRIRILYLGTAHTAAPLLSTAPCIPRSCICGPLAQ